MVACSGFDDVATTRDAGEVASQAKVSESQGHAAGSLELYFANSGWLAGKLMSPYR
jgi:hypothetical protein